MAKNYGLNLDSRLSASLERYFKSNVENNVFNTNVTLRHLWMHKETINGGESINQAITYLKNQNVAALASRYATIDTTPQDNETTLNDTLGLYPAAITISDIERDENAGENVFHLAQQKASNAMETLRDTISTDIWASSKAAGLSFNTLQAIVATTGTVHTLASASYWQAISTTSGSFAAQGLDDMRSTWNQTSNESSEPPSIIITTRANHEYFEKFGTTKTNVWVPPLTNEGQKLNLGYGGLHFKGTEILFDLKAPSGNMYFLNSRFTKLVVSKNHSFKVGKFIRPENALAETAIISLRGQIFTSKRGSTGVMTSITA